MERSLISLVAAVVLGLAVNAYAQAPEPRVPSAAEVSDGDLEKFADVYVALQETTSKYEAELLGVETEEEARDVQLRMQKESIDTVARHGWTADEYLALADTINTDPQLVEKTRRLIESRP